MSLRKGVLIALCLAALSIAIPQGRVFAQEDSSQAYEYEWSVTVRDGAGHVETYTVYAATGSQAETLAIARHMARFSVSRAWVQRITRR